MTTTTSTTSPSTGNPQLPEGDKGAAALCDPAASIPQPGLYETAPQHDYPMLHQSLAHVLVSRSPLHCWYKAFAEAEDEYTEATDRGQLAHALLLGGKELAVVDAKDWRTNAAKEQRDAARAAGKLPVLQHKLDDAANLTDRVAKALIERGLALTGKSELTAIWQSMTGVWCQGRFDHFILSKMCALILDLKFVRDASKRSCENSFISYGYDIQHAAYVQAVESIYPELAGRVQMKFVFVEADPPHAMRVMPLAGSMRTSGEYRWGRAIDLWARYMESHGIVKAWPAYTDDGEPAECPPWALNAQLVDEQIEQGGNL